MSKFIVTVNYTKSYDKDLEIYASDDMDAKNKAIEIVENWDGVEDVEVTHIEEE